MSKTHSGVLATYEHVDAVIDSIRALRKEGRRMTVMTPVPNHEIADELDEGPSPVRLCTFVGGVVGAIAGFGLAAWTSLDWPLITNGKELVSVPAFIPVTFECTVLFAGLTNLFAMLFFSGLPATKLVEGWDARLTEDRFGIWVPCGRDEAEKVAGMLRQGGAEEVRVDAA